MAEAAGGILNIFRPVSDDEVQTIERIARPLGEEAFAESKARLGRRAK